MAGDPHQDAPPPGDPHPGVRPEWLAQTREAVLDPGLPIIDAHHHLWSKPGDRYTVDEMLSDATSGHRIVATVFVEGNTAYRTDGPEALRPVGETEMAAAAAEEAEARGGCRVAAGIVARADLTLGTAVAPALDAHSGAAGGRLRGVRYSTPWHADPVARGSSRLTPAGLLYDPGFRDGLGELVRRDLTFDAWMYHAQLGDLIDLAHAMPDLKIVLDHAGGPLGIGPYAGRREEVFVDWSHWISRLARFENIDVKLGGLAMRLTGFGFHDRPEPPGSQELAAAWKPYIETCIDAFGPERCMFESNFPVDKGSASYVAVWNAFKRLAEPYDPDERHALFFATANRAYSLKIAESTPTGLERSA